MSRVRRLVAVATACAVASVQVPALQAQEAPSQFKLLGITDFHGHWAPAKGEPGAAALKCMVDRESKGVASAFVSSGDNVGGSPFASMLLDDAPTMDVLNIMGLDVSAVGNHEFDKGYADLRDRIIPESDFPILGANVEGADAMEPYVIKELNGVKVAFVGTVTADTASLVSPDGVAGLTFHDPVEVTNRIADELTAKKQADVVVALVHEGGMENAKFSPNVDIVFAGHTHLPVEKTDAQPVVLQAGEYGKLLASATLSYDRAADTVTVDEAKLIDAETIAACDDPQPEIDAVVKAALEQAEKEGQRVVAKTEHAFFRGTNEGGASGSNRGVESTLNNLLAEVARWGITKNTAVTADIGVMNAGGVRADLAAGEVTYKEAFDVQPFGNDITYTRLTGAKIKEALEQQWQKPGASRPVLSLGVSDNVSYTYDPKAEQGQRITSVTIDGKPLDPAKEYVVAGSTFLLSGGDDFKALAQGTELADTGLIDSQAFVQYLANVERVAPRAGQAGVGIHVGGELRAGATVPLELSSLMYSQHDAASEVTVELGGERVVAKIDRSLGPDGYGEAGFSTLTFAIPADAAGEQLLRVTTDAGTDVALPVKVLEAKQQPQPEQPEQPQQPQQPQGTEQEGASSELGKGVAIGSSVGGVAGAAAVLAGVAFLVLNVLPAAARGVLAPVLERFGVRL